MKGRGFLGIFSFICIAAIAGCAMHHSQMMKTDKGENIATDKLMSDADFKDHNLVKVALERNKESGFYGVQATYMNGDAYTAFMDGKDFPDGSKIALVFFNFSEAGGIILPGEKMWSATMKKTRAATDGNWAYSSIDYQTMGPKFPDPVSTCYVGCHKAQENNDYVFLEHPLNPQYKKQK